jgi:hypothetical protein
MQVNSICQSWSEVRTVQSAANFRPQIGHWRCKEAPKPSNGLFRDLSLAYDSCEFWSTPFRTTHAWILKDTEETVCLLFGFCFHHDCMRKWRGSVIILQDLSLGRRLTKLEMLEYWVSSALSSSTTLPSFILNALWKPSLSFPLDFRASVDLTFWSCRTNFLESEGSDFLEQESMWL